VSRWLLISAIGTAMCGGCGRLGFASGGDAAVGSAGGSDAGSASPDGPTVPSCEGFDVCDQFEEANLAAIWTPYGAVTHSTVAHRGSGSVHFTVPALTAGMMGGSVIEETATFATGTPPFWLRIWVRFGAHAEPQNNLELASADQSVNGGLADYIFAEADRTTLYSQFDNGTSDLPVALPLDTWTCLIWHVAPNDGTMTLDGDLGSSSFTGVTNGTPALSVIELGPNLSATNVTVAQPSFEVWIDDVSVHHAAVTCAD